MLENHRFAMLKKRHNEKFEGAVKDGKADKKIIQFCRFMFKTKNFFTLSSCSGRVLLLKLDKDGKKREAAFHAKWHEKVSFKEFIKELKRESKSDLWLKMEPFIYHIGCRKLLYARKLLEIKAKAGIKRGGIFLAKEGKFLLELMGTQDMALPIKINDEILLNEKQIKHYWKEANEKLERNDKARKRFEKQCQKDLKKL